MPIMFIVTIHTFVLTEGSSRLFRALKRNKWCGISTNLFHNNCGMHCSQLNTLFCHFR